MVLGTAFPHFIKDIKGDYPWEYVIVLTSVLAILGGILILNLVPDGPYRKFSKKINLNAIPSLFKIQSFRAAAIVYFGHMWELYAFWTFVPFIIQTYLNRHPGASFNISLLSFSVIAIGSLSCVLGGYISQKKGNKPVAVAALLLSCLCCLVSPFIFSINSEVVFVLFLLFWGIVVIPDSPLFSTLVAQNVPISLKGTALTIVNSIGFAITIISIQLVNELRILINPIYIFTILAIGPIIGLLALVNKRRIL